MPPLSTLATALLLPQPPEPLRLDNLAAAAGRALQAAAVALEAGAVGILVLLVANVAYAGRERRIKENGKEGWGGG